MIPFSIRVVSLKTYEVIDITDNLYWFEENGCREANEFGEIETHRGERFRIEIEDSKST